MNGIGISSSSPVHKLVGVTGVAAFFVEVGVACLGGEDVLVREALVGAGEGVTLSVLIHDVTNKMTAVVRLRSEKRRCF